MVTSDPSQSPSVLPEEDNIEALSDTLELLSCLHALAENSEHELEVSASEFVSSKLNQKLIQQIQVRHCVLCMYSLIIVFQWTFNCTCVRTYISAVICATYICMYIDTYV